MSNDRWTPRYEHDDAELAPEPVSEAPKADAPARAASSAPDWGGGTGASPTAKDWQEGRVDPAPWQQGMTAKELAAKAREEEAEEPVGDEPQTIEDEPTHLPAVQEEDEPEGPSAGLLYGLGMVAAALFVIPAVLAQVEMARMGGPWWSIVLGLMYPVSILLGTHVLLRILLSIRDRLH